MAEQPIPHVTRGDVERIIKRDFLPAQHDEVFALLAEYGREEWHREPDRVHLAIFKLSGGDINALRRELETAKSDYRDALALAEYPACMRVGFDTFRLPRDEQQRVFEQDWTQYQNWLLR